MRITSAYTSLMSEGIESLKNVATVKKGHRRPYKKSTQGCKTCKARKVKCDEARPVCGTCSARFIRAEPCIYDQIIRRYEDGSGIARSFKTARHGELSAPRMQQQLVDRPHGVSMSSSHMLELRLMHHYTESTAARRLRTAMLEKKPYLMWEVDIPQIAFTSDLVLNALFAVSALHLFALTPNDTFLAYASSRYLQKAVVEQLKAIEGLRAENIEPVLATAVLIIHQTWLTAHSDVYAGKYLNLHIFRLCEGTMALVDKAARIMNKQLVWPELPPQDLPDGECVIHKRFLESALSDLSYLMEGVDHSDISTEIRHTYNGFVAELKKNYHMIADGIIEQPLIEQQIVTMLHRVPSHFIQLLEDGEHIALLLFARNLALLELITDTSAWWIHGDGGYKVPVKAVQEIRKMLPPELHWAMVWPQQIIAGQVKLAM